MNLALDHALKRYEDARKLCHIDEDVSGINARNLVIANHPRFMDNAQKDWNLAQ